MNTYAQTAQAYFLIYRALPDEIKKEVHSLIKSDFEDLRSDDLYKMSSTSFEQIWSAPENDHWDDFFANRTKNV
jgi:hypothetical protein